MTILSEKRESLFSVTADAQRLLGWRCFRTWSCFPTIFATVADRLYGADLAQMDSSDQRARRVVVAQRSYNSPTLSHDFFPLSGSHCNISSWASAMGTANSSFWCPNRVWVHFWPRRPRSGSARGQPGPAAPAEALHVPAGERLAEAQPRRAGNQAARLRRAAALVPSSDRTSTVLGGTKADCVSHYATARAISGGSWLTS